MHGKAQREPARHSVVVDCKLVPLHNMPAVCHIMLSQCENLDKNSPTVLGRFWAKVHQIWGHVGKSL